MRVLVALDESPVSTRAARGAARLFRDLDAEFHVINVAEIPTPWVGGLEFGAVAPLPIDPRWYEPDDDEEAEAELVARAVEAGIPHPEAIVEAGDPVTQICEAAERLDVDVIVVGSHDKSALQRLVDPSVAAGVVRATYRPVLVISGSPPREG